MRAQVTPLDGSKAIGITFTDKLVTALRRPRDKTRRGAPIRPHLAQRDLVSSHRPRVPRGRPRRGPPLRPARDPAGRCTGVRQLLGLQRFPSTATFTRVFRRFTPKAIPEPVEPLWTGCFDRLPARSTGYTLDLDSSVFERYGTQEGALRGYNPRKRGRPSHHPLVAVLAEARCIAHVWLRSGNAASARGSTAFLAYLQRLLPSAANCNAVAAIEVNV